MLACQALLAAVSMSCTSVKVHGQDLPPLTLRTMELGAPKRLMNWKYSWYPRGQSDYDNNTYGYFALESDDKILFADGMNEVGLTVSALTFREATYQSPPDRNSSKKEVPYRFLVQYLLGTATNSSHAKQLVNNVTVTKGGQEIPELYIHWSITDKYNISYILEYINGKAVWHDDNLGVLTNDPDYSWHVSNLNNFVALSPYLPDAEKSASVGEVPSRSAFGTNLLGLPGDLSPPARFVRMFYLREFAMSKNYPTSLDELITLATGLANTVHIIKGVVGKNPNSTAPEATYWSVMKIPALRLIYFRSYTDMQWKLIDIGHLGNSNKKWSHLVESDGNGVKNITPGL